MHSFLFLPPIAFIVVWAAMALLEKASRKLAVPSSPQAGKTKAYACGETPETHRVQPDYSQFFPFAFFFTIMHVVALMVATVPPGKLTGITMLYFLAAVSGLFILFKERIQADLAKLLKRD